MRYYAIVQEFLNSYVVATVEADDQTAALGLLQKQSGSGVTRPYGEDPRDLSTDPLGVVGTPLTVFEFNHLVSTVKFANPLDGSSTAYESEYFAHDPVGRQMVNLGVYRDRQEAIAKNPKYNGVVMDGLETESLERDFRWLRASASK